MAHPTDIVIGTHNRVAMLQRTIACLRERTTTPYRLTVIDDASTDGTADYLAQEGIRTVRHEHAVGMHGNLSEIAALTTSDPVITSDDDCLCPQHDPDWLARLLEAMVARPEVYMLGLNDPTGNKDGARYPYAEDGEVVYSKYVSGHYLAQRRALLEATPALFAAPAARVSPNKTQAQWVHAHGYRVGYLKDIYTWHYCPTSQRRPGRSWADIMVTPDDLATLAPPAAYRQGAMVPMERTLVVGCGKEPRIAKVEQIIVNHDLHRHSPWVDITWDLNVRPWPWPDNAFDRIVAWAVLEHLKIDLLESMAECWRVLAPGGRLEIKLPYWNSPVSWRDPTHFHKIELDTLDTFVPETAYGGQYDFYTPYKWQYVVKPHLNLAKSSVKAEMQVCKP